jgi:Tol biopolymer transport system component
VLREDGHCSFSPDGRWVLNDTYPDGHHKRTLMLVRARRPRSASTSPGCCRPSHAGGGEIRCDLHPRWSRDGRRICIDSVHDGSSADVWHRRLAPRRMSAPGRSQSLMPERAARRIVE